MKSLNRILWGIVLVCGGVVFALKAVGVLNFSFFGDGWWTLLIIIPSLISLFTIRDKTGSIIGVIVGVVLFLGCRDIITLKVIWKLLVPVVVIIIGLSLIFKDVFNKNAKAAIKKINEKGLPVSQVTAVFSSQESKCINEDFYGAELTSVFGSVVLDLRGAYFREDAVINVSAIFGGIDIYLPPEINLQISATPVFGGLSDKRVVPPVAGAPTVYINGLCMFGGVDIK